MSYLMRNLAGLFLVLALGLFLTACGENPSSSSGANPGTPGGSQAPAPLKLDDCSNSGASATPAGKPVTPINTGGPTAGTGRVEVPPGYRLFVSNTFPYALAHPESWQIRENQSQGNLKGDLLIGEKTESTVAAVTIVSEKLADPNQDSNSYFQAKLKEITTGQNLAVERQPERNVGGTTAYGIAYNTPAGQPFPYPVQSLQEVFAAQGRGYVVSFSASPSQATQYCGAFLKMLDSWNFTGLVK